MGNLGKRVGALEQRSANTSDMAERLNRLTDAELHRVEKIIHWHGPATEERLASIAPHDRQFLINVGLLKDIPDE